MFTLWLGNRYNEWDLIYEILLVFEFNNHFINYYVVSFEETINNDEWNYLQWFTFAWNSIESETHIRVITSNHSAAEMYLRKCLLENMGSNPNDGKIDISRILWILCRRVNWVEDFRQRLPSISSGQFDSSELWTLKFK